MTFFKSHHLVMMTFLVLTLMFFLFPVIKSHHLVMMTFLVFDLDGSFYSLLLKSHHLVMMTFLVFDLDVLFIPCFSSFFLSFFLSTASIALPYLKNYPYYQHQILGAYVGLGYAEQCKISVT